MSDVGSIGDDRALVALRTTLARERRLLEPRGPHGEWREVAGTEPFEWVPRPASMKPFFFPPRETLLRWDGDAIEETPSDPTPFALFGARPCDVTALAYQDRFFNADPAYRRRRARALVIAVNCATRCDGGFCRDVGAGPFAHGSCDIVVTRLHAGRLVLASYSDDGATLLHRAGLTPAHLDPDTRTALVVAEATAEATFPSRPFIARARARIDARERRVAGDAPAAATPIADAEWQRLGPACFACTGCTNVCPTCSCFTIVDEPTESGTALRGERVRYWDSCLLEGFQREASGHHPAPRPSDRVRRFWSHKLSLNFADDGGRIGCVGCGRCDVVCPGEIGALSVLRALGGTP